MKIGLGTGAFPGGEVDGEIDPGNHHEKCRNYLQGRAVEPCKAGIMGRHTTDGNGAESMANRIEKCHASKPVGQCTQNGNPKINQPQCLGGFSDAGCQFAVL